MNKSTHKSAKLLRKAADRLPVSRKFYQEIMDRVKTSFSAIDPTGRQTLAACCVVETYLLDGVEPDENADMSVRLMFALLRPEIDKAMARSAAARSRRRKAAVETVRCLPGSDERSDLIVNSLVGSVMIDGPETEDDESAESAPAVVLNRRQRRLRDRIERRLQKKGFGCLAHLRK